MNFLEKVLIKQNFKIDLDDTDLICEKASECLDPLIEVGILYYIYGGVGNNPHNLKDIKLSLNALSLYLERLQNMQCSLSTQFKDNSILLKRYKKQYEETLKNIKNLHSSIMSLDLELRSVPSYENIEILVKSLGFLTELENQINANNGRSVDVAVSPRESVNFLN